MSLYQDYRPKNFTDVVGQDFVKKVLANSCRTQTFHHGYIFFGFHGIGKTTLARIFAEAVNCTNITSEGNPCHTCPNCLSFDNGKMIDVVEIDAASYTGVDNIREIIEHAKFTPTQGRFKVYIVDEVHMLSKGAFNALLKTLEEPPKHVIFLLATTEIHKVPDTILSRVIRFDLTKIGEKDILGLLIQICKEQEIDFEQSALEIIVHRARGSIRDALTMLEKCIIDKKVTEQDTVDALHLVNTAFLKKTFHACVDGQAEEIGEIIQTLDREGIDVREFTAQMTEWITEHIDESFTTKSFPAYKEIFDMMTRIYAESRQVPVPMDILKMGLLERIRHGALPIKEAKETSEEITPLGNPNPTLEPIEEQRRIDLEKEKKLIEAPPVDQEETRTQQENIVQSSPQISAQEFSPESYFEILKANGVKNTLIPLLKTAIIELHDGVLEIHTTTFCKTKCSEPGNYGILENSARVFGAHRLALIIDTENIISSENVEDFAKKIFA